MSHLVDMAADGVLSVESGKIYSVYLLGATLLVERPPMVVPGPVRKTARRRRRGTVEECCIGPDQFDVIVSAIKSFANKGPTPISELWAEVRRQGFGRCTLYFFPKHGIIEYRNKMFRVLREVTPQDYRRYNKEYQTYLDRRRALRGPQSAARKAAASAR